MRFEAWTLPWSSSFERVIADLPVVENTGRGSVRFNDFGEGSMALPADYSRIDDVISSTTGRLIRVYDGTDIIHEWVAERVEESLDGTIINVSGQDLLGFSFDKAVVYPYDYPDNPSNQSDWVYGGDNSLSNPGFEDGSVTPKSIQLQITATGGTYTLTDGTDTTSAIAYDAQAATIETRIEADLGLLTDVIVVQTGTSPRTFIVELVDPPVGVNLGINTGSLTGGTGTTDTTEEGERGIAPWTKNQTLARGVPKTQGTYDSEPTASSAQNHTSGGTYSVAVDPGAIGVSTNRLPGVQQVVQVTGGSIAQVSVWIYPTSANDKFRLGLFGVGEEQIAWNNPAGVTLTANTWNELTLTDVEIPDGVDQVIMRVAVTNPGPYDPSTFYVDDGSFNEGLAETTIGAIAVALMDDATTDHSGDTRGTILDWVDYSSFDATNDSSSAAWDTSLALTVYRGMSYGQFLEVTAKLGYEFELVPKASPGATTHDLNLYNPGNLDDAPGVGLITGQAITDGSVVKRIPGYTASLLEGVGGIYDEGSDATALSNFGRLEKYEANRQWGDTATLGVAETELFALESSNRQAVKAELGNGAVRPLVEFKPGDTLSFQIPGVIDKQDRRVNTVTYRNSSPTATFEVVGSRVFDGVSAVYESVRKLVRAFKPLTEFPAIPGPSTGGGAGGAFTIQIAASDATQASKDKADLVCTGSEDQAVIRTAIEQLGSVGGRLLFSEGNFDISMDESIVFDTTGSTGPVHFQGSSHGTTFLIQSIAASGRQLFNLAGDCQISDIFIQQIVSSANTLIPVRLSGSRNWLTRVNFFDLNASPAVIHATTLGNNDQWISECYFDSTTRPISMDEEARIHVLNNTFRNCPEGIKLTYTRSGGTGGEGVEINGNIFVQGSGSDHIIEVEGFDSLQISNNSANAPSNSPSNFIHVDDCTSVSITGNTAWQYSSGHGIYLNDVVGAIVSSNELDGYGDNTADDAIHVAGASTNIVIAANAIRSDPDTTGNWWRYGIYLNSVSGATVIGNSVEGVDEVNIRVAGDDNLITGNHMAATDVAGTATDLGIEIVSGNNNAVFANFLGDSSDYGTADSSDSGTGTIVAASGGAIGGQFAY